MNVLVVDDEKEIADLIEVYLKNEGYRVFKTYDSTEVMGIIKDNGIELAILDVMMPNIDGFSLVLKIREKYHFPIVMVTAKIEDIDKVQGLTIGADDYIVKPFKPMELIARVKAQIRRYKSYNGANSVSNAIEIKGLSINNETHECFLNGEKISLTPIEFSILWFLLQNNGKIVKTDDLYTEVWNEPYYEGSNNTIMVHIRHLREKMKDSSDNPEYIKTVWGVGYKIDEK